MSENCPSAHSPITVTVFEDALRMNKMPLLRDFTDFASVETGGLCFCKFLMHSVLLFPKVSLCTVDWPGHWRAYGGPEYL